MYSTSRTLWRISHNARKQHSKNNSHVLPRVRILGCMLSIPSHLALVMEVCALSRLLTFILQLFSPLGQYSQSWLTSNQSTISGVILSHHSGPAKPVHWQLICLITCYHLLVRKGNWSSWSSDNDLQKCFFLFLTLLGCAVWACALY